MPLNPKTRELRETRKLFREYYSPQTEQILKGIASGQTSHEIAEDIEVPVMTVAATKANYTRNTYYPFAYDDDGMTGTCRF